MECGEVPRDARLRQRAGRHDEGIFMGRGPSLSIGEDSASISKCRGERVARKGSVYIIIKDGKSSEAARALADVLPGIHVKFCCLCTLCLDGIPNRYTMFLQTSLESLQLPTMVSKTFAKLCSFLSNVESG